MVDIIIVMYLQQLYLNLFAWLVHQDLLIKATKDLRRSLTKGYIASLNNLMSVNEIPHHAMFAIKKIQFLELIINNL